jgi:hypothetical protein
MINRKKVCGVYELVRNLDNRIEYKDDTHIIPRSTPIIVKRRPAAKHGRGSATKYIADNNAGPQASANNASMPAWQRTAMSKRFDGKDDTAMVQVAKPPVSLRIGNIQVD